MENLSLLSKIRQIINPPYSKKNLLVLSGTFLILFAIPVTVFVAQQRLSLNSKAAGNTLIVGSGQQYTTIQSAVAAATAGDTVSVKAGTYPEQVAVNKSITISASGTDQVWIDGACSRNNGILITSSNVNIVGIGVKKSNEAAIRLEQADNITLDKLTIQDYNCTDGDDQFRAGVASWYGGKALTVKNSTIKRRVELSGSHDGFGNGIWLKNDQGSTGGGGHYFANNTIVGGYDGIGGEPEDVNYGSFNKNTTIENNIITDCGDDGIQSEGGNQNNIIRNNTIKRCLIGIAFTPALTGPLTILRNVISEPIARYNLGAAMFKMGDGSVGVVKIYHNSFYAGSAIADGAKQTNGGGLSNLDFKNNAIYASRYVYETGEAPTGTSNYSALYTSDTSRFIKWAGSTYSYSSFKSSTGQEQNGISSSNFGWNTSTLQLQSGSPLIDKGVAIPGINDGFSGTAPDIGAFEFGTGDNPPTPQIPTVNLKANNTDGSIEIANNTAATLSWTSTNATSCNASSDWSGSKSLSGSESTGNLTSSKTYVLVCTGSGGVASATVIINVSATPPPPPSNTDTDGDGFSDVIETYIGTDPLKKCGTGVMNSLLSKPSRTWPPDVYTLKTSKQKVNSSDAGAFVDRLGTKFGDSAYHKRFDLDADGDIDLDDINALKPTFNQKCQ